MKKSCLIKCWVFASVIMVFTACGKEKNTVTEYIGTVVEGSTMAPLPNVKVSVTNGSRVLVSTNTDEEGAFSILVNIIKLTDSDSLLLDGSPNLPYQKKYALMNPGKEQYDYRAIVLYDKTDNELKTFQYKGTTYYVHPEVGTMTWESAVSFCDNLTYAGCSDWFLPDKDELNAMYVYRNSIGGFVTSYSSDDSECYYWSSTEYYGYFWCQDFSNGEQDYANRTNYLRVRPIRKDNGGGGGTTPTAPSVTTSIPSGITTNSAICGGNVTTDSGANVIQRGVCYGTSQNPNTSCHVVTSGAGTGTFTCTLTGLSANTTYYVRAYAINSVGTAYGEQKSFTTTGGGGGGGQTYTFDFESSLEGWSTIDADGDGYNWVLGSNISGVYLVAGANLTGSGHNASADMICSGSYSNELAEALTPDNYLVSPQKYSISNGAKISLCVSALDADYPAEHYGIAVSTAANPTANSFVMVWEETLSAKVKLGGRIRGNTEQGTWYLKTIDLSAYAGQSIWIAIRHFNVTDQFIICVDDVTIKTGN